MASLSLDELEATFLHSEARLFDGQPFQLTGTGIWLATPFPVLSALLRVLEAEAFWHGPGDAPTVVDAGMGDGRVVAAFAWARPHARSYGIESHGELYRIAKENLTGLTHQGLSSNWRLAQGDFLDPATYADLGISFQEVDVVFNYADGNEHKLAALLSSEGRPGARLAILTMDQTLDVPMPVEKELVVEPSYRFVIYRNA